MNNVSGHIEFNGPSQEMKFWRIDNGIKVLLFTIEAHGDAVGDPGFPDVYGRDCKCPPGEYYVGEPQPCASRNSDGTVTQHNPDDAAYGMYFAALLDPHGIQAAHGRAGIGVHGGGSVLPDPFALIQGWYATEGCLRLSNLDNEQKFVPFVRSIRSANTAPDTAIRFSVTW